MLDFSYTGPKSAWLTRNGVGGNLPERLGAERTRWCLAAWLAKKVAPA